MAQSPAALLSNQQEKDDGLVAFNLQLLLGITWLPFPTAVLAEHFHSPHVDQQAAALMYAGSFFVIAIVFNVMWRYAVRRNLVADRVHAEAIAGQYSFGPIMYGLLVAIAFFGAKWCLALSILYALYFALPPSLWKERRLRQGISERQGLRSPDAKGLLLAVAGISRHAAGGSVAPRRAAEASI